MISIAKYGDRYPGERVRVVGILPEPAIADLLLPPTCLHGPLRRILRIHSKKNKKQNHGVSEKLYIISLWTVIYHTFTPRPKAKAKIKTKTKKTTNFKSKSKSHWEGWPEHKHLAPKTKRETETLRIIFWTKTNAVPYNTNTTGLWQEFFLLQNTNIGLQIRISPMTLLYSVFIWCVSVHDRCVKRIFDVHIKIEIYGGGTYITLESFQSSQCFFMFCRQMSYLCAFENDININLSPEGKYALLQRLYVDNIFWVYCKRKTKLKI